MRWCVGKINEGETQLQEPRNTARRQEPKEGGVWEEGMKVSEWTGFHYINFLHNYHCHLDFYQDKACQGNAAAQYSLFMPKWQNLYVTYLERYCVLLYQNPPLGHQSPGACSLSCQPAPSESKWWFLVYIVQRHFVMSRSVWSLWLLLGAVSWHSAVTFHIPLNFDKNSGCSLTHRVMPESQESHTTRVRNP